MTQKNNWFEVDKAGLSQLLATRGKAFALTELIQNAWDENVSEVKVTIEKIEGRRGFYKVAVEDDNPEGWADLSHSFTLFAPSAKKGDATKRGRFNLGEKLVLAVCESATISTVKGTVEFTNKGRRVLKRHRDSGSVFEAVMKLTLEDIDDFRKLFTTLIPPAGIINTLSTISVFSAFEDFSLTPKPPAYTFTQSLPTVCADAEGNLKRTRRTTTVELHEVDDDTIGKAHIYELGIPVVALTDDRWHINILQKVPLNSERDNVPPAYLKELRVAVLNQAFDLLSIEESTDDWVSGAAADERASEEVVEKVLTSRFGEKRVAYDPSDPEANKLATSKGYTVVTGGSLSSGLWRNAKSAQAIKPAGQVTPSPKPYSDDPNAPQVEVVPESEWTKDQEMFVAYANKLHQDLIGKQLFVSLVKANAFRAAYGGCNLHLNVNQLSRKWFASKDNFQEKLSLLLHEFAHYSCLDHLDHEFHNAICNLGAKLAIQLGAKPEARV